MREPRYIIGYLFDRDEGPANHLVGRWLFLRSLGLIYFSAFFALAFQILGLIGSQRHPPRCRIPPAGALAGRASILVRAVAAVVQLFGSRR